jgi:hypothetical protein
MDDQERIEKISELRSKIADQELHCKDSESLETISGPNVQDQEFDILQRLKEELSRTEGNPPAWVEQNK